MKEPINILFVVQYGKIGGGVNKTLTSQLSRMDKSRFKTYVLVTEEGPIVDVLHALVNEVVVVPVPQSVLYKSRDEISFNPVSVVVDFIKLVPFFVKSLALIKRMKIDVIHCNNLKTNFFGIVLSKISHVPVICHIRSATPLGVMGRIYELGAASIISVSHGAQELSFSGPRKSPKHKVIYNGRDLAEFVPALPNTRIRQELNLREDELVVAIVGGIIRWKGHVTFLQAAKIILDKIHNVKFLIVGNVDYEDPSYYEELCDLTATLGIVDQVVFTGYRTDVQDIYAIIDILVSASWYEPLGGVILEAMSSGKPVVGTNAAGTPEIVVDGETGLLVPPEDPISMADAVLKLLQDDDLRNRMGESGRGRAERVFSIEQYVSNMQSEYEAVVDNA